MNRLFIVIILFCTLCGSSEPIGVAFVIGPRLPVHPEPDRNTQVSTVLAQNSRVDIMKSSIPDAELGERSYWYRVRLEDGSEGYVSYDEEVLRKNMASFRTIALGRGGLITASSLRLRREPSLTSEVVDDLPRGTVVQITREGSIRQTIEDREDVWVEVKTDDNKVGYSFAGFMQRGPLEDLREQSSRGIEQAEGYVFITADSPTYYRSPEAKEQVPAPDYGEMPGQGEYARITSRSRDATRGEYYYIEDYYCPEEYDCAGTLEGWISATDAEYVEDFVRHSLTRYEGEHPQGIFEAIVASEHQVEFDATRSRVEELEAGPDSEARLLMVYVRAGHRGENSAAFLVSNERETEDFSVLGRYDNSNLKDIDGDGRPELIAMTHERAATVLAIYSLTPTGPVEILPSIYTFGGFKVEEPYIVLDYVEPHNLPMPPFDARYNESERRVLRLQDGAFSEVDPREAAPDETATAN